jgi:hypothetical protein
MGVCYKNNAKCKTIFRALPVGVSVRAAGSPQKEKSHALPHGFLVIAVHYRR